jgi:hypothetical protein
LKISRETARNQLKSVFAKTDTHCQSELVALLMRVEKRICEKAKSCGKGKGLARRDK